MPCATLTVMDDLAQAQQIRENTERIIRGSIRLINETRTLLKEADAICQTSRARLDSQQKSLLANPDVRRILGALD